MEFLQAFPIAIIDEDFEGKSAAGRGMRELAAAIEREGLKVTSGLSYEDACRLASVFNNESAWLVSIDGSEATPAQWGTTRADARGQAHPQRPLPIFLFGDERTAEWCRQSVLKHCNAFMRLFEDSPEFWPAQSRSRHDVYLERLAPPMFKALMEYTLQGQLFLAHAGHGGGVAFRKSPVGQLFYQFFGENTLRSDISVSGRRAGSLLDPHGPIAAASVTRHVSSAPTRRCSSSAARRPRTRSSGTAWWAAAISCSAIATATSRSCILWIMTGATPIYLVPSRNGLGIIGPISQDQFTPSRSSERSPQPVRQETQRQGPAHGDDQLDLRRPLLQRRCDQGSLGNSVEVLHFDEAWYAYANFHEFYDGFHGYRSSQPQRSERRSPFATHSTHKLLAALVAGFDDPRAALPSRQGST
jgi:arginine decarboxylase